MSDWKHECDYKEPEECAFCEHFNEWMPRMQARTIERGKGDCSKDNPVSPDTPPWEVTPEKMEEAKRWAAEHKCHAHGTCRHFKRRTT